MAEENRYSRQIYSVGEDVSKKISHSTILLINYSDLTQEIAKNLILMGFNVDIDTCDVRENGLYYENVEELKKLNPLITVNVINNNNKVNKSHNYSKYKLVVLTNSNIKTATYLNNIVRNENVPFIYTGCYGLMSFIFNDLLDNYTFFPTINNTKLHIENVDINEGIITFKDKHHFFQNNELNLYNFENKISVTIKVLKIVNSIKIIIDKNDCKMIFKDCESQNTMNLNKFEITSKIYEKTFKYKPLFDCLDLNKCDVTEYCYDLEKSKILHTLHIDELDGKNINTITAIASITGGICAHEVLKIIGNKNTPIKQWFYMDFFELGLSDNQYIIDPDILKKVKNTNAFVVGCGAIGCELLKHLAILDSKIIVTDMDSIEKSNLSRQFLFDDDDVGLSKSEVASEKIKKINKNVNITSYNLKLCLENGNIFNDDFHNKIDVYLNALDNVDARAFTNDLAIKYTKPLIDSGTSGSTQVIIPNVTEGYVNQNSINENIPICTIKSFPYKQEHTIQWARELFEQEFNVLPKLIKKDINSLNDDEIDKLLKQIYKYKDFDLNFKSYFHILTSIFYDNFETSIDDIYKTYEPEKLVGKTLPKKITICNNLSELSYFINYGITLLNQLFKSEVKLDEYEISEINNNYHPDWDSIENKCELLKSTIKKLNMNELIFEKDDDNLKHIHWIATVANLRNIQYSINTTSILNTKKIAGKIIPAIITTTSIIAGFQIIEYLKIIHYENKINENIEKMKNIFINLDLSYYIGIDPSIAEKDELEMTVWDNFIVNTMNTEEIIDIIDEKYNKTVDYITNGLNNNVIYDGDDIYEETIDVNNNTCVMVDDKEIVKMIFYKNV